MKLINTQNEELSYIKALVYGDSGVGKTTSIRTLPADRTLVLIGERGAIPLRDFDYKAIQFRTWVDVRQIYEWLNKPDACEDAAIRDAIKATDIIVIDSLSEISDACCHDILTVERRKLVAQRTDNKREAPVNVYEELMQMEDYGLYRTRMGNLISAFCHLPRHVVFTSLAAWSKDKTGGDVLRLPNLSGKAAWECVAHFGLVLYMTGRDDGSKVWQTFNDGLVRAKDESGKLDQFEEPNWTKVFTKIVPKKKPTKGATK
jgi:hypothetical protein